MTFYLHFNPAFSEIKCSTRATTSFFEPMKGLNSRSKFVFYAPFWFDQNLSPENRTQNVLVYSLKYCIFVRSTANSEKNFAK